MIDDERWKVSKMAMNNDNIAKSDNAGNVSGLSLLITENADSNEYCQRLKTWQYSLNTSVPDGNVAKSAGGDLAIFNILAASTE
jgi:hypothetical protein